MKPLKGVKIMTSFIFSPILIFGLFNSVTSLFKIKASSLLEKENKFFLLSSEDNDAWEDAWETYKLNNLGKEKDEWNIKGWKNISKAPEEFKNTCKSSLNYKVSGFEDPIYTAITSYCTRPKKLSEAFEKDGIKLLSTEGDIDPWIDKFINYQDYLDLLPLPSDEVNEDSYERILAGCWALGKVQTTNLDYERATEIAKFLCLE